MRRLHVEVVGRVQGVGFRWFVREHAHQLDLAGWVLNRDDGAVELVVEGDAREVETFIRYLRDGPPGARVHDVRELDPIPGESLPRPFSIRR